MTYNPFATKLMPWQIAIARRQFVLWATLPMIWSEAYWKTWNEVYRGTTHTSGEHNDPRT